MKSEKKRSELGFGAFSGLGCHLTRLPSSPLKPICKDTRMRLHPHKTDLLNSFSKLGHLLPLDGQSGIIQSKFIVSDKIKMTFCGFFCRRRSVKMHNGIFLFIFLLGRVFCAPFYISNQYFDIKKINLT